MWMNNVAFKKEFNVDTILEDFVFEEREPFLEAYPQGYHKCDKLGRPVYIQLLGKVNVEAMKKVTTEDRMIKFHIQEYERCRKVILPVCSKLAGRNIDQTFGIMDVKGVGLSHFTGEVKRLLGLITKYDQDNYPEMLGHICVINAPWVFRMIWAVVRCYLDPRTQSKIEILDSNYLPALLKWVDKESLPEWLGGSSHGTLIEDIGPWSNGRLMATLGLKVEDHASSKVSFCRKFAASVGSWKSWNVRHAPFVAFLSYIYHAASVYFSNAHEFVMCALSTFCFTNRACHGPMAAKGSSAQ
ncbi:CRAL-TRIO domain-containing protein [Dunaliella salina]|nr:CRAL-TRIO domain-containing protein [Dunaliella salina]|eukprot:KAF5839565.1 CRAL-TRIO domain-containing protein [Dunaliella salina]